MKRRQSKTKNKTGKKGKKRKKTKEKKRKIIHSHGTPKTIRRLGEIHTLKKGKTNIKIEAYNQVVGFTFK